MVRGHVPLSPHTHTPTNENTNVRFVDETRVGFRTFSRMTDAVARGHTWTTLG